jgi:hypothetical protein
MMDQIFGRAARVEQYPQRLPLMGEAGRFAGVGSFRYLQLHL